MLEDIYIIGYLIFSSVILLYMITFIKHDIEEENKNPYLPFCISSPLLSPYNYNKV